MMVIAAVMAVALLWTACGIGTVWYAARVTDVDEDMVVINFVIWPIALIGSTLIWFSRQTSLRKALLLVHRHGAKPDR